MKKIKNKALFLIISVLIIELSLITNIDKVNANSLSIPEIISFSQIVEEDNALKVTFKSNNIGNDYSYELINITTGMRNRLAGTTTSYTYQNLEAGKEYEVAIRACISNSYTYSCTMLSKPKKAVATKHPATIKKGVSLVKLDNSVFYYNGYAKNPKVIVKDNSGKLLTKDKDYKVIYPTGRINIGNYIVTVNGINEYSFNKKLPFKVNLASPIIYRTMPKETAIDVQWSNIINQVFENSGTQVAYKKSSSNSWKYIDVKQVLSVPIYKPSLESNTNYDVKVRAFNVINNQKVYSAWSKTETIKTLKKNTKYEEASLQLFVNTITFKYDGKEKKPTVMVKDYNTGKVLTNGTHYKLVYPKSSKNIGYYTIKVTGKGKYAKNYPQYLKYRIIK